MPSKRSTPAKNVHFLSAFLTLPIMAMGVLVGLTEIKMTSPDFCGKTFMVDVAEKEYVVVMNKKDKPKDYDSVNKHHKNCTYFFQSVRRNGRLCGIVVGKYPTISDYRSFLHIYDGKNRVHKILDVSAFSKKGKRTACTQLSGILQILWGPNGPRPPDPFAVTATFHVVDIRSRRRQLAMEENFCSYFKRFTLDQSMVQVVNTLGYPYEMHSYQSCFLIFDPPSDRNRRICGAFIPSRDFDLFCSKDAQFPWELLASKDERAYKNKANDLFRAKCGNKSSTSEIVSFCAPQRYSLTLCMKRKKLIADPAVFFYIQVADWKGSEDDFLAQAVEAQRELLISPHITIGRPKLKASTSSAVAVTATSSLVFAETILLVFSPNM